MRRRDLAALATVPLLTLTGATQQGVGLTSLQGLRNQARPLLLFAPKPDDPRLEIQLRTLLEHAAEANDRQIIPLGIMYNNPSPTQAQLSPEEEVAVRRRFGIAPATFTVILLGKDGGEKLRADRPLSMHELNRTIDAMPMRQDEMRRATPQK